MQKTRSTEIRGFTCFVNYQIEYFSTMHTRYQMLKKSIEVKLNAGCSLAGAGQLRLESELKVGKKQGQLKFADLRVSSITKCNSK